jgi:hypothetical protein
MNILESAISMVNEYSNGKFFNLDAGEFTDSLEEDLKNELGMTDEEIEIYKNKHKIDKNLIFPISFTDDFEDIDDEFDENDILLEEELYDE